MDGIQLVYITPENWEKVCLLDPGEESREFVADNSFSIAQSVFEKSWIIQAIQREEELIGFTMYGFSEELGEYELCRFMLDWRYQGNGYGKKALRIILTEMQNRFSCQKIYTSTSPKNARARHVYESAGFVPTGETQWEEDIFCLHIAKE